jgi:hypothetical protein
MQQKIEIQLPATSKEAYEMLDALLAQEASNTPTNAAVNAVLSYAAAAVSRPDLYPAEDKRDKRGLYIAELLNSNFIIDEIKVKLKKISAIDERTNNASTTIINAAKAERAIHFTEIESIKGTISEIKKIAGGVLDDLVQEQIAFNRQGAKLGEATTRAKTLGFCSEQIKELRDAVPTVDKEQQSVDGLGLSEQSVSMIRNEVSKEKLAGQKALSPTKGVAQEPASKLKEGEEQFGLLTGMISTVAEFISPTGQVNGVN